MARFIKVQKQWYPVPDDAEGAKIEIKYLTPGEETDLQLESLQVTGSTENGVGGQVLSANLNVTRQLVANRTVTDWSGFFGPSGKELKCNRQNIAFAVRQFDWFSEFLETSRNELRIEVEMENGEAVKN